MVSYIPLPCYHVDYIVNISEVMYITRIQYISLPESKECDKSNDVSAMIQSTNHFK